MQIIFYIVITVFLNMQSLFANPCAEAVAALSSSSISPYTQMIPLKDSFDFPSHKKALRDLQRLAKTPGSEGFLVFQYPRYFHQEGPIAFGNQVLALINSFGFLVPSGTSLIPHQSLERDDQILTFKVLNILSEPLKKAPTLTHSDGSLIYPELRFLQYITEKRPEYEISDGSNPNRQRFLITADHDILKAVTNASFSVAHFQSGRNDPFGGSVVWRDPLEVELLQNLGKSVATKLDENKGIHTIKISDPVKNAFKIKQRITSLGWSIVEEKYSKNKKTLTITVSDNPEQSLLTAGFKPARINANKIYKATIKWNGRSDFRAKLRAEKELKKYFIFRRLQNDEYLVLGYPQVFYESDGQKVGIENIIAKLGFIEIYK